MPEDVSRALGANGANTVIIGGVECTARPLKIKEVAELQRICLDAYKRQYIRTFSENADLYPPDMRFQVLQEATERAGQMTLDNLPSKKIYNVKKIIVNEAVKSWVHDNFEEVIESQWGTSPVPEQGYKYLTAKALDRGALSDANYKKMAGKEAKFDNGGYLGWWTEQPEGAVAMMWLVFRSYGVTREQVEEYMDNNMAKAMETASEIETLTVPKQGNAE